ncbi:hypothetical protein HYPSUDRAFT_208734 [Hypholoma sublateritium FD-334 SS-4]|uniref:Uncharacterized protein n=1 Tax=Hypholoma sublateritium (strain FD-334 SS-4) TaxID=945553 RepID=A0A0D2NCR7_HYPSF|nr:hypothetical protein HYPSUDRAFT_208734 [Hypholoma sublateritium FD-334 SS-4]
MPSTRVQPLSPSQTKKSTLFIRARVYASNQTRPSWRFVPTQSPPKRQAQLDRGKKNLRYPWVEGLFNDRRLQPYIHDTIITVSRNGSEHKFVVFCQNHRYLPSNATVGGRWRGNIVVMKIGTGDNGVVNMPLQDSLLIDDVIIHGFVTQVKQQTPFRFPKNLVF